jgi:selenocysteine-specific elongation factor
MKSRLVLGTAGHVDHGKTRLIEALTGTDTDRLPEEKRRGISIALGYAQLELPGGTLLSVIDVPGHERFVRTMVAGATGVDLFLLVVDAGEGPKPQTFEHLEILRLLGIEHGAVALTKIDAVSFDIIEASESAIQSLLPGHEVVRVSATEKTGLQDLVSALARAAEAVGVRRRTGPSRLYVDRTFSLPGAGPVVTGTLWSGTIGAGDRLTVLPESYEIRVRSVEVHGHNPERALPGQRVGLAITAGRRRRPRPGDAIVSPGSYTASYRLDVVLDAACRVPGGARVTVLHGTSAVPGRVIRLADRFAQLRLERPLVTARDDLLVLRQERTIGGARVLDSSPPRRLDKRRFTLLEHSDVRCQVAALVDAPVETSELRRRLGLDETTLDRLDGFVRTEAWMCSLEWLEGAQSRAREMLEARASEIDPGLGPRALLGDEPWAPAHAGLLQLESKLGKLYLPGHRPDAAGRADGVEDRLTLAGLIPVAVGDNDLVHQLEREGRLVKLGDGLAIGPAAYRRYRELLMEELQHAGTVSLAGFRDRADVSRRVAQLVLERFDSDRVTLRVGDERRVRRSAMPG